MGSGSPFPDHNLLPNLPSMDMFNDDVFRKLWTVDDFSLKNTQIPMGFPMGFPEKSHQPARISQKSAPQLLHHIPARPCGLSHRLPPAGAVPVPPQTPAADRRWPVPGPQKPGWMIYMVDIWLRDIWVYIHDILFFTVFFTGYICRR